VVYLLGHLPDYRVLCRGRAPERGVARLSAPSHLKGVADYKPRCSDLKADIGCGGVAPPELCSYELEIA